MEIVKPFESVGNLLVMITWTCLKQLRRLGGREQRLPSKFPVVERCSFSNACEKERSSVVSEMEGALLRSRSWFAYYMVMAFEGGGPLRAFVLLVLWPLAWVLYNYVSEAQGMRLLIFVAFAGMKEGEANIVARAVLPKFFIEDMHCQCYKVFVWCEKRYVVTGNPRIMVEPFLKEYLNVENVIGTELQVIGGYCTGLVAKPGVLVGMNKLQAVKECFGEKKPDIGLAQSHRLIDCSLLSLCKEGYMVPTDKVDAVAREHYLKPVIFHDGRLVARPTPLNSIVLLLWFPIGIMLAITRMLAPLCLPHHLAVAVGSLLGVRMRIKGAAAHTFPQGQGVLYVCSHRTLLDPVFLTSALGRPLTAVTYSLSRMSEVLSPIKTVRLTRNRTQDGPTMQSLLKQGDLAVCPEGTTCREPYLLRFSCLFAELTDDIVPVAMKAGVSMFYGTTARGFKCLDPIFFLMNPCPRYDVHFLEKLPKELTCSAGKSSLEVANHIQKTIADALGFQCTNFTRRDKYMMLAGNEGFVTDTTTRLKSFLKPV